MLKGTRKFLALLLTLIMLIGALPLTALAETGDGGEALPFTLTYKIGEDGEELIADAELIGTSTIPGSGSGTAYVVSLPYGAEVTSYLYTAYQGAGHINFGSTKTAVLGSLAQIDGYYIENEDMVHPAVDSSYKTMLGYITMEGGASSWLEEHDVYGFAISSRFFNQHPCSVIIVQISTKAPATEPPLTVTDMEGNAYTLSEVRTSPTLSLGGDVRSVDYADGVYTITVPKSTTDLRIALGDITGVPEGRAAEDYAFFSQWNGEISNAPSGGWRLIGNSIILLDEEGEFVEALPPYANPKNFEGADRYTWIRPVPFGDGYFTLPISEFILNKEYVAGGPQEDVYGTLDPDCEYAEVLVGTLKPIAADEYLNSSFSTLLLVKFEDPSYMTGPARVQLLDGTDVDRIQLPGIDSLSMGGTVYPFDQVNGFHKLVVPAGTTSIRLKLNDSLTVPNPGDDPLDHYVIGRRGMVSGSSMGGVPIEGSISIGNTVSGKYYSSQNALDKRISTIRPARPKQNIINSTITNAVDGDGWFTLPLSEFAFDPVAEDHIGAYGTLDSTATYAEINLQYMPTGERDRSFSGMLLIQIGGNQGSGENITPIRKLGVPAAETVELSQLEYSVDLSDIFEDLNGDPMTYKVKMDSQGEYTPMEGSVFTYIYTGQNVDLYFTANDGYGDGAIYRVMLRGKPLGLILAAEAIIASEGVYWKEYDFFHSPTQTLRSDYSPGGDLKYGFYQHMILLLDNTKRYCEQYGYESQPAVSKADRLRSGISLLMTRDRINTSRLWLAVTSAEKRLAELDNYTEVTTGGLADVLADARTVYTEDLYLSSYDAALQGRIDDKADLLLAELDKLVHKGQYKTAYDAYRARKDEAADLLLLCDPAKYNEADYTPESWQAFTDAYNALKADLEYRIEGEGGTTADWLMVKDFVKHLNALQNARNNLVSDRDITVSFSYINNFAAMYPEARRYGQDIYNNESLELSRGATTVYQAIQTAGLYFDRVNINRNVENRLISDGAMPKLMVYVNGISFGLIDLYAMEAGNNVIQLHDGDRVKVVRVPTPVSKFEVSSGYDTTVVQYGTTNDISHFKDSIAVISIDGLPQGAKVGDKAPFAASVKGGYATNLNQAFSPANLSLYVSGPTGDAVLSQDLAQTTDRTDAKGNLTYIFTQPGWYTVAVMGSTQESYTYNNVYGETTYGSYTTIYAGDFALVYVAPAADENALIAAQRAENLAAAKAFYEGYHDYDIGGTAYANLTSLYQTLADNQNAAATFKELVDSFNADYAQMQNFAAANAIDHAAVIGAIRSNLVYIPADPSAMDYTYSIILSNLQYRYGGLNNYQKTLLSRNEQNLLDALMLIDKNNLYTPSYIYIDVAKDAGVVLPSTYGNLASAPNENRVYTIYADGRLSDTYYQYKTGSEDMEPLDSGMRAYPGNRVNIRRVITQSEDAYWLVYSLDEGVTWKLMELVDGGANSPMVMLQAWFLMPDVSKTSLTIPYKTVSREVYEDMKLGEETPGMALEEAKAAYKASLNQLFESFDPDRYEEDYYIDIRDAKNKGLDNIDLAKEVTFALKAMQSAASAMRAVPAKTQVRVIVRNDVFPKAEGAAWEGVLVDKWVNIDNSSSMMGAIKEAVESEGYTGEGFDSGYISDINGLGEFGGGGGSGWMGTLNDWFTNEGFSQFTVANGKLKAGDLICAEYTRQLGADIRGGVEGNTDTSLFELSLTGGTLNPAFGKDTADYLFTLDEEIYATQIGFSPNNRSFQARGYLNTYTPSANTWITAGMTVPVQSGDILYIGVGEQAWASMGKDEPTVYTIAVVDDSGAAETLIQALPEASVLRYSDKADVDRAYAVYQSLSSEQKAALGSALTDKLMACVARIALLQEINEVQAAIESLPNPENLTIADCSDVESAKMRYDSLEATGQDELPLIVISKLNACVAQMEALVAGLDNGGIYRDTGAYLAGLGTPGVGSIGGEWLIVGLSRAEYSVPSGWAEGYYANALAYINEHINDKGQLHVSKSTDNARMILALTALGKDVTNVGGKNLLVGLTDMDYLKKQGINGPIWALIAFDSHDYAIPTLPLGSGTQVTRENLISTILADQLTDGGWALSGIHTDPDMTGMALQALAPYYGTHANVKTAVDRALTKLSSMQGATGGFCSWGTINSESSAQVIVALTALGINPDTDSRFIKNGYSAVDALYAYSVEGGGFRHVLSGNCDGMASEQGYYTLVAYSRLLAGKTSLYDMSDVTLSIANSARDTEMLIDAIGTVTVDSRNAIQAARTLYNKLTAAQKAQVSNYATLMAAEAAYKTIMGRIDAVKKQIEGIGTVQYDAASKSKIEAAQAAYDRLLAAEKKHVTNYATLTNAQAQYIRMQNAQKVIDLIDAIGEVTGDSGDAIAAARKAYNALSNAEKVLVSNYTTLTAAERKFNALDPEANPEGKTKVIGDGDTEVVIGGVTYMVDAPAAKLMRTLDTLSKEKQPDPQDIIDVYKTYMAMSNHLKAQGFNYDDLEAMTIVLGEENHKDEATGIEVEGLDWHIQLTVEEVSTGVAYDTLAGRIGSNDLVMVWDIKLTDLLTGETFEPGTPIKVRVKAPDVSAYEQIRIAHLLEDGRVEYYDCILEGGYIIWEAASFSPYGLIGGMGEAAAPQTPQEQPSSLFTWLWILIACLGVAGVSALVTVILSKRKKG